jgi:hypothetical protein
MKKKDIAFMGKGGVVLQLDQASPNQGLLWHIRECGQDTDMDRQQSLCTCGHCQTATKLGTKPLHNSIDFECVFFRENPYMASAFASQYKVLEVNSSKQGNLFEVRWDCGDSGH